jgi:hypothetical protein
LATVIERWPALPADLRAAIVVMVGGTRQA